MVDASTTDGEEYADDVTYVQCITKKNSMPSALKTTSARVSSPKIPRGLLLESIAAAMPDARPDSAGTAFFAFLLGAEDKPLADESAGAASASAAADFPGTSGSVGSM